MYVAQVAALSRELDMKKTAAPSEEKSLTGSFADPVINLEIRALRQTIADRDREIEDLREELRAATFDPNAMTGLKLMKKCKKLLDENQELGKQLAEDTELGTSAKIAAEKAQQEKTAEELREAQEFNQILDEENDKLQTQIAELTR